MPLSSLCSLLTKQKQHSNIAKQYSLRFNLSDKPPNIKYTEQLRVQLYLSKKKKKKFIT